MKFCLSVPALAAGTLLLGAVPAVQAQVTLTPPGTLLPTTGTREITVAGNYSFNGDKPYALAARYGLFTTPAIELGIQGSVAGAQHATTASSLGAIADYYFTGGATSNNPLLPFVGVFAGYSHVDQSSGSVGAQGGVKYFFNPNVAANLEIDYRASEHTNGKADLLLGFSTFFR